MLNEKKYWESLDDYFNHTRSLVNLLDLRKSLLSADKKKKFLTTLDEIKNLIEEQIDFNENGNKFYNKKYGIQNQSHTVVPVLTLDQEMGKENDILLTDEIYSKELESENHEINNKKDFVVNSSDENGSSISQSPALEMSSENFNINITNEEIVNESTISDLIINVDNTFNNQEETGNSTDYLQAVQEQANIQFNDQKKDTNIESTKSIESDIKENESLKFATIEKENTSNGIKSIAIKKIDRKQIVQAPKVNFYIANGKLNQFYQEKICFKENLDILVDYESIEFLDDLGLKSANNMISGLPNASGTTNISFNYRYLGENFKSNLKLVIVADPKDLWEVHEPPEDSKLYKEHEFYKSLTYKQNDYEYKILAASRRGRSHEHNGSFRDDHFEYKILDHDPSIVILAVADGAGSAQYSREGSRIATEKTISFLNTELVNNTAFQKLENYDFNDGPTSEVNKELVQNWNISVTELFRSTTQYAIEQIQQQVDNIQSTFREFATTLQIVIVKHVQDKRFISSFWIGDGAISIYNPNKVRLLGETDGGDYVGQTVFLNPNLEPIHRYIRISIADKNDWLFLMTDGVSDPYFDTDQELSSLDSWTQFVDEYEEVCKSDNDGSLLSNKLHFFKKGHHDDRTLVVVVPLEQQNTNLEKASQENV